jgi:hypothetical protein
VSFRAAWINEGGYIYVEDTISRSMVHRETRNLHYDTQAVPTLDEAKRGLVDENNMILELTPSGGGAAVWVKSEDAPEVRRRLQTWSGCYGAWPVKELS